MKIIMNEWHDDQFVSFVWYFLNCLMNIHVEYLLQIISDSIHVSKILNCECNYPPIDDYIMYKLCEPQLHYLLPNNVLKIILLCHLGHYLWAFNKH